MPFLGEIAALGTAVCWVGSSLAFAVASRTAGAQATNHFRLVAAVPLLMLLGFGLLGSCWPGDASAARLGWIAASGIVGLVVGDLGYFHALATIGPRLASVVMALWPACTVGLDALCGAAPGGQEIVGIGLTIVGVVTVLLRSREGAWRPGLTARQWLAGVAGALLGALGQAGGFVLVGIGMAPGPDLAGGVAPLHATIVRMVVAAVAFEGIVALRGQPAAFAAVVRDRRALAGAAIGAVFGPVLGVWLSMVARRHASDSGVAAALMATTPVWMLPVSVWWYGARVGVAAAVGTVVAVAGVAVCLLAR